MGDDNGKAFIYDMADGSQYGVTIDSDLEAMVADRSRTRPQIFGLILSWESPSLNLIQVIPGFCGDDWRRESVWEKKTVYLATGSSQATAS